MPFIPHNKIKVGSIVIITKPIVTMRGTFTAGTKMIVTGRSVRGWDLKDEDGNLALEVFGDSFTLEQ